MRRLFQIGHLAWVTAQLRAPIWAQKRLFPSLHRAKELIRLRPSFAVHRLHGENAGGALIVDYVGRSIRPSLENQLFDAPPHGEETRRVPLWRAASLAGESGADLSVVVGGPQLIRLLPRAGAIVLPFYVQMIVDVHGSWDDLRLRFHRHVRRGEFRLIRKFGYEYEVSDRWPDFKAFYRNMYAPTLAQRKGELASPKPKDEAGQIFKYGGVLHLVKRDGRYVAGSLAHAIDSTLHGEMMGVLHGDEQLVREGGLGAVLYAVVHWANCNGYQNVDLGGVVPRLNNGVFQAKRKWGAAVAPSPTVHKQIWIKIHRHTPAVAHFFKENPLITLGPDKRFHGLIVVDDPNAVCEDKQREWISRFATPGLADLRVCTVADLIADPTGHGDAGRRIVAEFPAADSDSDKD